MDGKRVPGAPTGPRRRRKAKARAAGLQVTNREGYWHITGTVRAAGKSRRVRKSSDLEARPEFKEDAEQIRRDIERDIVDELVHGIRPSVTAAVACDQYLARDEVGPRAHETVKEVAARFMLRKLSTVAAAEWSEFVDERHAGNKPETRERYLNALLPFLRWCHKKGWLRALPEFERRKDLLRQKHRRARRVNDLTPELIMVLLEEAAPHLAVQLATEWSTGARVSSILYGCRICDLALERLQITFHDTKNGDPVVASLHPAVVPIFERYLTWRGGLEKREAPLFLTHRREPYAHVIGAGGQNKRAFGNARRRAVFKLLRAAVLARRSGDLLRWQELRSAARLLNQVTQHWFRHKLATDMMAYSGNPRAAMEQGGWRDLRSVLGYTHDVPEQRRNIVAALPIDTARQLTDTKLGDNKQVVDK